MRVREGLRELRFEGASRPDGRGSRSAGPSAFLPGLTPTPATALRKFRQPPPIVCLDGSSTCIGWRP